MSPEILAKVEAISKDYERGLGKMTEICKKYGLSSPYYYQVKKRMAKAAKKAAKRTKVTTAKTTNAQFIDIPLHPENHTYKLRIFEVTVSSKEELRALLGAE